MEPGLALTIIVAALVVAGFSGVVALLNRPPGLLHLLGLAAVELVLLVQAGVAIGRMFSGDRPDGMATFIGYLLTALLIPPLAALFGAAERSRWGSLIIGGGCLVVAVMVVRLGQVWNG